MDIAWACFHNENNIRSEISLQFWRRSSLEQASYFEQDLSMWPCDMKAGALKLQFQAPQVIKKLDGNMNKE